MWSQGDRPRVIASILILYCVAQLVGMAICSSEIQLARAELFTVLARTFAPLAPLEFYVGGSEQNFTVTMLIVVSGFALAYIAICAAASLREERNIVRTAQRFAPTLIPIAAVYFIAHYFAYWLLLGQISLGKLADPLNRGWVPDYGFWVTVPAEVIWAAQVILIVWGHIVAVIEAHPVSLRLHRRSRNALLAQTPLILLMVGYTLADLWVLGKSISSG